MPKPAPVVKIGDRFGRWTLVNPVEGDRTRWVVRCDCGTTGPRLISKIIHGSSRSCGCNKAEVHSRMVGIALQRRGA